MESRRIPSRFYREGNPLLEVVAPFLETTMNAVRKLMMILPAAGCLIWPMSGFFFRPSLAATTQQSLKAIPVRGPRSSREGTIDPIRTATTRVELPALSREAEKTGRLALPLEGTSTVFHLFPNEIRTADYTSEVVRNGRPEILPGGPCRTYRGFVEGVAGSDVRLYVDENYLGGIVLTPSNAYHIEADTTESPNWEGRKGRFSTIRISRTEVVKEGEIPNLPFLLNGGAVTNGGGRAPIDPVSDFGSPIKNLTIAQRVLQVVTDCDFEYVRRQGGAAQANARLLSFLNAIDPLFQKGVGVRIRVSGQVTQDSFSQVYTGNSTKELLQQLSAEWGARPTPSRAFVMLVSGKTFLPETDLGQASGGFCPFDQGFVAREASPSTFGPFATMNLLSGFFLKQVFPIPPLSAGDPECGGAPGSNFIGQEPLDGTTLAAEFCPKSAAGFNLAIRNPFYNCVAATAESTVQIVNSTSRIVPAGGGTVSFTIQSLSPDWQVFSRVPWMTSRQDASGEVTVTVASVPKGSGGARIGEIVMNGARIPVRQE